MKEFFYTDDSGRLKKYLYCSRGCPEPYKQHDVGFKILKVTPSILVCRKCVSLLSIKCDISKFDFPIVEPVVEPVELKTEKAELPKISEEVIEIKKQPEQSKQQSNFETPIQIEQQEPQYTAYVLQCKDLTFYCGVTINLENAIKYHNGGSGSPYTKSKERRPVKLVDSKIGSQEEARQFKIEFQKKYMVK
ncbi:MAG: GIY-YIG nuclease family protein [Candidatus Nanoarchaeia archaeon]|jgi:predicted GIY-YIG superfamily endonuclease|nr:GIY-YIG nuclease family protein [Candidatus Nanoarchaeia archaeon]